MSSSALALIGDTFQARIGIWKCWFLRRGEKPLGAEKRTNYKLNPHMTPGPGIEPRTHWWEASALTTAPSLLPYRKGHRPKSRSGLLFLGLDSIAA